MITQGLSKLINCFTDLIMRQLIWALVPNVAIVSAPCVIIAGNVCVVGEIVAK